MKKIASLFKRNYDGDRLVFDEVVLGSEWVLSGEGTATRKFDGTACMVKEGILYKRYDAKHGKTPPFNGIPCEPEPNKETGHWPFWVPVDKNNPQDKWFIVGFNGELDGTYELCGEKINSNRENLEGHRLIRHGSEVLKNVPNNFEGIKNHLKDLDIEGIVWHHADGRMVKIKKRDFGFKR